ncbi:membrane-associated transporter protein-like [Dermacentor andersoni]|uniref:membrane-associated transporter protein-like n=1 Tax=Dermacentor andersoni TaxID=34620 RepID=UPI0021552F9D|nr:proton-associated sugar transporter A-like [Dermacentor andersoni]XP_050034562.1 proton-associated sugar transporter A-like [Dermacentor andersoni]
MGSSDIQCPLGVRDIPRKYAHIFRKKRTWELVMLSGAVCGIELCYAAETAFIGPILLGLGIPISFVALTMCLSPALGFFITPLLGSMSDTCASRFGRRRPFIVLLSLGMLLGLILLPNGQDFGIALGDSGMDEELLGKGSVVIPEGNSTNVPSLPSNNSTAGNDPNHGWSTHGRGIAFTIAGFVFLDMCCDACQSPARSYVLDVTIVPDHARALSMFTVLSGLSGAVGYIMGGIDWESTAVGASLGGHVKTVFGIVGAFFVVCIVLTLTSFREMPLHVVRAATAAGYFDQDGSRGDYERFTNDEASGCEETESVELARRKANSPFKDGDKSAEEEASPTVKAYLLSIIYMPRSMMLLCITNLFCWMALVSYSLFLTDFVGAVVYGGDPVAHMGTESYRLYQSGVRLGCFGLAIDSVTCALYSLFIEKLVDRFGAKPIYVLGQAAYCVGVALLAIFRTKAAVLLVSPAAGLLYATQFTMPFILVAHYHSSKMVEAGADWSERGLGTDIALVSSMMFPAQLLLSLCAGPMVRLFGGTPTVIMYGAALVSACGALCATRVTYHKLR